MLIFQLFITALNCPFILSSTFLFYLTFSHIHLFQAFQRNHLIIFSPSFFKFYYLYQSKPHLFYTLLKICTSNFIFSLKMSLPYALRFLNCHCDFSNYRPNFALLILVIFKFNYKYSFSLTLYYVVSHFLLYLFTSSIRFKNLYFLFMSLSPKFPLSV